MHKLFIICGFILVNKLFAIAAMQSFQQTPKNQTVVLGDTIYLHCSVNNKSGELQWTKDGFGLGMVEDVHEKERYSMILSNDNIHFDLMIHNVTLDDEGVYQCQVGPGFHKNLPLRSENAIITVDVPTSSPVIIQGDTLLIVENKKFQLDCISRGGKPVAEVLWIDDTGNEIRHGVEIVHDLLEDEKRYNVRSVLRFQGSQKLHNKTFTCQAHNRPAPTIMITHIRIKLTYSPTAFVEVSPPIVREHDTFHAFCHVNASPPATKQMWYLDGQLLKGEDKNELVVYNVSRKLHHATLACFVENDVGHGLFGYVLSIVFSPRFRTYPKDVYAKIGTTFTLYCDAVGNPHPIIFWLHDVSNTVVHHGSNYTEVLTHNNQGNYSCHAQVQGYTPIATHATVTMLGPPKIVSKAVQFGKEGETVLMECEVNLVPIPYMLSWTRFGGSQLGKNNSEYLITEEFTKTGVRSVVRLKLAKEKHFGLYTCTVANSYGQDSLDIYLLNKFAQKYLTLILFNAGAWIIMLGLCTICIYLCLKIRRLAGLNRNFLKDQTETALSESVGPTSTGLENTHPEAQQQRISNVDNVYEIPNHGRQQASHSKPNESQTRCIDAIDSSSYISRPAANNTYISVMDRENQFTEINEQTNHANNQNNPNSHESYISLESSLNLTAKSATQVNFRRHVPPPPPLPIRRSSGTTNLSKASNSKDESGSIQNLFKPNFHLNKIPASDFNSTSSGRLGNILEDIQRGVQLKPTKLKRSITAGPTDGLGQALSNALAKRKKAVNPDSCSNSSIDNDNDSQPDEWQ